MERELKVKLAKEFEFMRRKPVPADSFIDHLYDTFGIDIGDGWYQLLYDLCKEIAEVLAMERESIPIVVDQIKEKYGTLRFDYHLESAEQAGIQAFDFTSLGSMHTIPESNEVYQKISKIVDKYEDKSEEICETCGCKGTLRTDLIWIKTLCDICYLKSVEKDKKMQREIEKLQKQREEL